MAECVKGSPEILVLGYNAWDVHLPTGAVAERDAKYEVSHIAYTGGGPGATASFALVRLGAQVKLATQLGDDLPGRLQHEELSAIGVDLSLSRINPGFETPKAVILVDPRSGERTIFWTRGDLPPLSPDLVDYSWLDNMDLFYTDGHETAAARKLALEAKRRGLPVVMDAGSVRTGSVDLVAAVTDAISSEGFAPAMTGNENPAEALRALHQMGPERVAMTFGARGVLALESGVVVHIPAFKVRVVDTTGAGDAFHAGYAFARATGRNFTESLTFGSAVAGLKCEDWGGRAGLPELSEVEALVQEGQRQPLDAELAPLLG